MIGSEAIDRDQDHLPVPGAIVRVRDDDGASPDGKDVGLGRYRRRRPRGGHPPRLQHHLRSGPRPRREGNLAVQPAVSIAPSQPLLEHRFPALAVVEGDGELERKWKLGILQRRGRDGETEHRVGRNLDDEPDGARVRRNERAPRLVAQRQRDRDRAALAQAREVGATERGDIRGGNLVGEKSRGGGCFLALASARPADEKSHEEEAGG